MRRVKIQSLLYGVLVTLCIAFVGCSNNNGEATPSNVGEQLAKVTSTINQEVEENSEENTGEKILGYAYNQEMNILEDNYQTYYEVFLYSFYDSNGDGIGDINGLISKLDYINDGNPLTDTDLGFTGIWLMPIMQSPTYHKYDVVDYYSIDKEYGTMEDFERLIRECNKRGIDVILDLVLNHTSTKHEWFLSAIYSLSHKDCGEEVCSVPELCEVHNKYCSYYNFKKEVPSTGTSYYKVVGSDWYYEGDFWDQMPDLNLDNEELRKEIEAIMDFWLDKGVHGFRLDAALHFYPNNTQKNNEVIGWITDYVKSKDSNNYIVAEVWTGLSEYVEYYRSGTDSIFNFSFATETGKIAKTLNYKGTEYSAKIFGKAMIHYLEKIKAINEKAIDASFFTNHDTGRASGYLRQEEGKIKMAGAMNLFMNGNVFVYYGEEIGMSGSGIDENKRAPMNWSDIDTIGMTWGPQNMQEVTHKFGTVEQQIEDELSIYNFYKRAIRIRNENPEIARGDIAYVDEVEDEDVCAITKTYQNSQIIMIYNLSKTEEKMICIPKNKYFYEGIRGYLSVDGSEVVLKGDTVTLPAYSIVVLK